MDPLADADAVAALTAWLREGAAATHFAVACLSGAPGVGKMTVLRALATVVPCELLMLTPDRYHTATECIDQLVKWCTTQSFDDAFAPDALPQRVVVLDALDVFMASERTLLSALSTRFKVADVAKWRPLRFVIVAPTAYERRVHEAMRMRGKVGCVKFALPAPTAADALDYFNMVTKGNAGLKARLAKAVAKDGNVAFALECLGRKDDKTCKDAGDAPVSHLWTMPMTRVAARTLLDQDTTFHPLRFHENCLAEVERRQGSVKDKKRVMRGILEHMVQWDQLFAYAASGGGPLAEDMATEHVVGAITHWLSQLPPKRAAAHASHASFTKMLSNMSLQKKTQRRDASTSIAHTFFPVDHIGSWLMVNDG